MVQIHKIIEYCDAFVVKKKVIALISWVNERKLKALSLHNINWKLGICAHRNMSP